MPTKRSQDILDLMHPSDKKVSKPLMEKRRRARINHSLAQLKALVIDPNTTERSRQAKLEKADILELTVRHLHEIKRQQITALTLESHHPKKKFEIGYAECVREVELFLSNLIDSQRSGLDGELQKRLKDHLSKRLDDFRNIEPLIDDSGKEPAGEEPTKEDESPLPSPSVDISQEDLPLPMVPEEMNCSQISPLKKMLQYYCGRKNKKQDENGSFQECLKSAKRLKKVQTPCLEEDEDLLSSCQSVTSTTEFKTTNYATELIMSKIQPQYYQIKEKSYSAKKQTVTLVPETPSPLYVNSSHPSSTVLKNNSCFPSSSHMIDISEQTSSTEHSIENNTELCTKVRNHRVIEQIPLVPRQLANGDWALVLPASLVPTEEEKSCPISAFRLVVPSHPTSSDSEYELKCGLNSSSSPLSSTVSDMSTDEYIFRSDSSDPIERMEHSSPDSTQIVWRPW